jgi:threonine/homoserine/homoserine lactone efflux protein
MTFELFIAFFASSSLLIFIPGPTVLLVARYALLYGKWAGRFSIPAVILGDISAITLAFTGLGAILKAFPEWFSILKTAGGVYLITLGLFELYNNVTIKQEYLSSSAPRPGRKIFTHVYLITAFNPKTIIFFVAFFPLFIDPTLNTQKQMFIMGAIFVAIGATATIFYDLAAARISVLIGQSFYSKLIHISTAILLCTLGVTTIFL